MKNKFLIFMATITFFLTVAVVGDAIIKVDTEG